MFNKQAKRNSKTRAKIPTEKMSEKRFNWICILVNVHTAWSSVNTLFLIFFCCYSSRNRERCGGGERERPIDVCQAQKRGHCRLFCSTQCAFTSHNKHRALSLSLSPCPNEISSYLITPSRASVIIAFDRFVILPCTTNALNSGSLYIGSQAVKNKKKVDCIFI